MSDTTELIELPPKETALQVFTDTTKLDEILSAVREKVIGTVYDMSKRKDREACASDAYKVARTKAAIAKLRATVSAELKELPKKVDAGGRYLNDGLEAIQSDVRAPLDAWEKAEEERIRRHRQSIEEIANSGELTFGRTAAELKEKLSQLEQTTIDDSYEEYAAEAATTLGKAISAVRIALADREKYEAEQAELARLRTEAEERRKQDEAERIAREAAERATRKAEAKAQAERDAAAKREADAKAAQAKAEQDAKDAVERQKQAEARAEAEKLAAEQRAKDAAEAARLTEIKRQADARAVEEAEQRRREADKQHKASINNAALAAFIENGLPESCAKQAVVMIAKGLIPAVKIIY